MLNEKESGKFEKLYSYLHEHDDDRIYRLAFPDGRVINARYDTDYEYDNQLESDDPDYEEFIMIRFWNLDTGELFEFHYADMPEAVYHAGERII